MTPPSALKPAHRETPAEEVLSCITHGVGALLSAGGLAALVTLAALHGDARRIVAVTIYGACLVVLYLASTLYHACRADRRPLAKRRLQLFDHAAIYFLIAGTYTPFLLVLIRGGWGWGLLGVLWGLALVGTVLKVFFVDRFDVISTIAYVLMGWSGLAAAQPVLFRLPGGALAWILAGGVAYTAGVVFYLWDRLPFNHAVWHCFVLAGSACHFIAVAGWVVRA
jgi:hemolysin III